MLLSGKFFGLSEKFFDLSEKYCPWPPKKHGSHGTTGSCHEATINAKFMSAIFTKFIQLATLAEILEGIFHLHKGVK
jgi:hypothetical protein